MKKILVAVGIIIIAFFTGCTAKHTPGTTTAITTEATTDTTTTAVSTKPMPKKENIKGVRRSELSKKLRKLYDDSYQKILRYEEFTIDTTADYSADEVYIVLRALKDDFPEFWLYLSSWEGEDSEYSEDGEPIKINSIKIYYNFNWLSTDDSFSPAKMEEILSQIDEVCDDIISEMQENSDDEEKYLFLCKTIATQTTYVDRSDEEEIEDWSYCYLNGPLLKGEGLCQAYAQAYQYLCNRAGLWCICIDGDNHVWNMIKVENSTYHVDVTWFDTDNGDSFLEYYFMMTQEEVEQDHELAPEQPTATGKK